MALFGIGKKEKGKEEKTPKEAENKAQTSKNSELEREKKSISSAASKPKSSKEKAEGKSTRTKTLSADRDLSGILLRPRITEKATFASEKGVYVFEVSGRSTKKTIKDAIERFYKVTPLKVNIVKIPAKVRISKWRKARGVKPGGKKAYVYLKKGDRIEIV